MVSFNVSVGMVVCLNEELLISVLFGLGLTANRISVQRRMGCASSSWKSGWTMVVVVVVAIVVVAIVVVVVVGRAVSREGGC